MMSRGRNKLIAKRNAAIYNRWLYWTEDQRLRFDDALTILSEAEFFLSEDRILRIIREQIKSGSVPPEEVKPVAKTPRLTQAHRKLVVSK